MLFRPVLALGLAVAAVAALDSAPLQEDATEQVPDFGREVQPILAENCYQCHGNEKREAELRLDDREEALKDRDGYAVVVPGDLEASEIWYRITTDDLEERMPPAEHAGALSAAEVDVLRRWIEGGAPWAEHWSLTPLHAPALPMPAAADWQSFPVDRFLGAAMEEAGVVPAEVAAPEILLRRLSFALTGLPPTDLEVAEYLNDTAPDAWERQVDRLLASPHFGEHWARHWMDLVRYAETRGHEFDFRIPNAFEYRDYLVRAFNADIPYPRLVAEHVAGDLLADPRPNLRTGFDESPLGTGFWFLGEALHSPVDLRVDQSDRTANRLDVLSKTFLGLTLSCARCHDHRFDPIPTTDYYALAGVVQSGSSRQLAFESQQTDAAVRVGLTAIENAGAAAVRADFARRLKVVRVEEATYRDAADEARKRHADRREVFQDFEGEDYGDWMAAGTAFGKKPRHVDDIAEYQGDLGAHGEGMVNSHDTRDGEDRRFADVHIGELWSPEFEVAHDSLRFLVGGGDHEGKTCVQLRIDNKSVLEVTGQRRNRMEAASFDLRPYRGQTVRVVVVDKANSDWGNIGCDWFVFEDQPEEIVAAVARERGLNSDRLLAWFRGEPQTSQLPVAELSAQSRLLEDWGDASISPLIQDGSAFVRRASGEVLAGVGPEWPVATVAEIGAAYHDPRWVGVEPAEGTQQESTDLHWRPSARMLRSRNFVAESGRLHYLVRGVGTAFASPVGYRTLHLPLYRDIPLRFDTGGEWKWLSHDLGEHSGMPMHVEFSPESTDAPDLAIAMMVEGDAPTLTWSDVDFATGAARQAAHWSPLPAASEDVKRWFASRDAILGGRVLRSRRAPAMLDANGMEQRLMLRGDAGSLQEPVPRQFLELLGSAPLDGGAMGGSGRLQLAEAMIDPANPLVSRVYVNRVWHHLWGRGLVDTTDNFGLLGRVPDRPDLLDHLAVELRDGGGSTKQLIRSIVLSRAWKGASVPRPESVQADVSNRFFHHVPLRRLEAEAVRDAMLTASGMLDRTVGGPSVAVHLTDFMKGRGRPEESGPLDGAGRRTLYLEVRRNFQSPLLTVFDFPTPFTTIGRRTSSNVPAQYLALMNGPLAHYLAEQWAQALLDRPDLGDTWVRIEAAYRQGFGRSPSERERELGLDFLGPGTVEDWTAYCHALFQVKEFIHVR